MVSLVILKQAQKPITLLQLILIYEAKKDEVIRVMEIDATTKVEATSLKDTKMIVDTTS